MIFSLVKPSFLDELESQNDQVFFKYKFFSHLLLYGFLFLPPLNNHFFEIIPYFLGITLIRSIFLYLSQKGISIPIHLVFLFDSIIYLIIYETWIRSINQTKSDEHFFLINSYSVIGILFIASYSLRLEKGGTLIVSSYLILLHCIYIYYLPDSLENSWLSLVFPIVLFFLTGLFGAFYVRDRIKNLSEIFHFEEDRKHLNQELELARKVQDALFPKQSNSFPLKVHHYRTNPNVIGGDFFDFVDLREGNFGVFFTDVAGHGISSALVAAILKVLVSTMPYLYKQSPSKFLDYLDFHLANDLNKYHASAIYLFFDFHARSLKIGNAGHPYLLRSIDRGPFQEIETDGSILGFRIKKPIAEEVSLSFLNGDRFFLYTDGLTESRTKEGEELGVLGMIQILNSAPSHLSLEDFGHWFVNQLHEKYGIVKFLDDTMFLILEA